MPHASTYAARRSLDKELRYLSNLSMYVIYLWVKSKSIPMGHLPTSKLLFECRMDKYETRRQNLAALLQTHCGGRAATLADLIERSPSYVSRMLYPEGKEGKKRIGEDMRDLIEDALSLPRGTLDKDQDALAKRPDAPRNESPSTQAERNAPPAAMSNSAETTLERLDHAEKVIIELFRRSTDEGKTIIHRIAMTVPKVDD